MTPKRLSSSAQLTNCNVGPCCHGIAHIGACWHWAFSAFHLYQFLSFANNPWAGLGWIFGCCLRNRRKTLISTKACFRGKAFLGKPATITFGENKDVNSWIKLRLTVDFTTILLRQPSEELVPWEQTPEHNGIDPKHVRFRPSWLFQKGCFSLHSCQTAILGLLHLSYIIHLSSSFSSMKFFLGLALGESCVASTTTAKQWCPMSIFSYCRGKAFLGKTCNNHLRRKQGCKLIDQNLEFRL